MWAPAPAPTPRRSAARRPGSAERHLDEAVAGDAGELGVALARGLDEELHGVRGPKSGEVPFRVTSGVERKNTCASRTTKPRVSFTLIRTVIGSVRERIGFGENVTWSITSRSFDGTLATGIDFSAVGIVIAPDSP